MTHLRFRPAATVAVLAAALSLTSCATMPTRQAWRPWTKIYSDARSAPAVGARLAITTCEGTSDPLFARDIALRAGLVSDCAALLRRRGYDVSTENPDYTVRIHYSTVRQTQMSMSTSSYTSSTDKTVAALGVTAANDFVHALANAHQANQAATSSISSQLAFDHAIGIEFVDRSGATTWEGDARWITADVDLQERFEDALKQLFSSLPSKRDLPVRVDEVNPSRFDTAYWLHCNNRSFSAPGLPFVIEFPSLYRRPILTSMKAAASKPSRTSKIDPDLDDVRDDRTFHPDICSTDDYRALLACLDLVRNAEIALPQNGSWNDPLKESMWARVRLGGRYELGSSGQPVNVIVDLEGSAETRSYVVKHFEVVNDSTYDAYNASLARWNQTLGQYYNVIRR